MMTKEKATTTTNLEQVLTEFGNDFDTLEELIRLFKLNTAEFINNVNENLLSKDLKAIAYSAHKLKPTMAILKATSMQQLLIAIETKCKEDNLSEAQNLYNTFSNDYPLLENAIDKELQRLKKI